MRDVPPRLHRRCSGPRGVGMLRDMMGVPQAPQPQQLWSCPEPPYPLEVSWPCRHSGWAWFIFLGGRAVETAFQAAPQR